MKLTRSDIVPPTTDELRRGAEQRLPFVHGDGVEQRLDQHHHVTVLGLHLIHKGWCICTSIADSTDDPALGRCIVQQVSKGYPLCLLDNAFRKLVAQWLRSL